jgi:hypothetical protein
VLVQVDRSLQVFVQVLAHSLISLHEAPSEMNPLLQTQVNDPGKFEQEEWVGQLVLVGATVHSSTSTQVLSGPATYPGRHLHRKEPSVLVQVERELQVFFHEYAHSFSSVQMTPFPV